MSVRSILISILFLSFPSWAGNPPHSLYLCTNCFSEITGTKAFFFTQQQMFLAEGKSLLAVGMTVTDDESLREAKKAGMPLYPSVTGDVVLQDHRTYAGPDSKANMRASILKYLKQLDRTQPVTIHISDHGWNGNLAGRGALPPDQSGIVLRDQVSIYETAEDLILTHREFADLLKEAGLVGPGAPQVRIVAEHCYGGGAHWISETFPNVCTAAFSSNEETNMTSDNESFEFWKYVGTEKKAGRKANMTDAFYAGWSIRSNPGSFGAALGSVQYAKNILKKNGIDPKRMGEDTVTNWADWEKVNSITNEPTCESPRIPPPVPADKLATLKSIVDTLYPLPKDPGNIYRKAYTEIAKNEGLDRKLLQDYDAQMARARNAWNKLSLSEKAIASREYTDSFDDFMNWAVGDFESTKKADLKTIDAKQKAVLAEAAAFQKANFPKVRAYIKNRELVEHMGELNRFSELYRTGKVSETEMATYRRMVECESQPL